MGTLLARLNGVSVWHGHRRALDEVDLDLVKGRQVAVLGPSGAGKSTLLRVLAGEQHPSPGRVEFPLGRPRQGVVRQEPLLFEWLTVAENVALGQTLKANTADPALVAELLGLLGIADVASSYPDQISGGQAQRAAFARALAIAPDLLLLDEPFSALDPATRTDLQSWLVDTLAERGLTSVLVTHDIDEALVLADDIVLVNRGRVAHRWVNTARADGEASAHRHPLRAAIRAAYGSDWEPGDEEFSGPAPRSVHA